MPCKNTSLKNIAVVNGKINNHNGYGQPNVERKLYSNKCKRKPQENLSMKLSKILLTYISQFDNVTNNNNTHSPKYIYNASRKLQLTLPKTIDEWQGTFNSLNLKTDINEQVLLFNDVNLYPMIFLCYTDLKTLCQADIVYMDETFEYCSKFFT